MRTTEIEDIFPYFSWSPADDGRTSDEHLALASMGLDGTSIFRVDDPLFGPWFEARRNGDRPCRCGTSRMSVLQAAIRGVREAQQWHKTGSRPAQTARGNPLLYLITEKFANIDLHPEVVSNEQMGHVFEELIRKFAELSNETAGEHFTPREVIRLMVNLLFIEDDDALTKPGIVRSLYDPTAGTGGMLSVADDHLVGSQRKKGHNPDARLVMYGQELNAESYAICKADMLIKGQDISNIIHGNTLSDDGLPGKQFDYMLSNPPFGVEWKKIQKAIKKEHEQEGFKEVWIDETTGRPVSRKALAAGSSVASSNGKPRTPAASALSLTGIPISRIFKTADFGYQTITVERPERDAAGNIVKETKGKRKGKPRPDSKLRDSEDVPLGEDVDEYFQREVLPHVPDAWIDHDKTKIGYEIPFNRHFYLFKPPRELDEIDAELKGVTDRIVQMIGELS